MSKQNLIDTIAKQQSTSQREAARIIDAFLTGLTEELASGRSVTLVGFGSFKVVHKEARMARSPFSGEQIQVGAKNVVKFKTGGKLMGEIN